MTLFPAIVRHVLIPTDGSQPSLHASQIALKWAALHKARVTFVYVVDITVARELATASPKAAPQWQEELEVTGQRALDYLTSQAAEAGLLSNKVMRRGAPYEEIADVAREQGVGLIVIGQTNGLHRHLAGSMTERVIECAPCPVLVVK